MAILTLTPSRFAASNTFNVGAYAYIVADRAVRKLGVLITPEPITLQVVAAAGIMSATLVPNSEVDEAEPFLYTVSVFDVDGSRMYTHNIVMPTSAADIFDIVPVEQDLDACIPTTLTDNS